MQREIGIFGKREPGNGRGSSQNSALPRIVGRWLTGFLCALVLIPLCFATDKYFPHGAVGTSGGVRAEAAIELFLQTGGSPTPASGIARFFDPTGTPIQLKVTGGNLNGLSVSEFAFVLDPLLGKVKLRYRLESVTGAQEVFWVELREQSGEVDGKLQFDFFEGNQLSTSIPIPAVELAAVRSFSARRSGAVKTGLAVSNPASSTVDYWLVAVNDEGDVASLVKTSLPARGQTAQFVDQIFPELSSGFDGFISVVSNRNLAAIALEQSGLELSTASEVPVPRLPFLAGRLEDYLAREINHSVDYTIDEATLTLTRGGTIQTGQISADGNYLLGPLTGGDWVVRVDSPGFLSFQQVLNFPRTPQNLELTSLRHINPEWLGSTLAVNTSFEGTVVKPDLVLNFFFDTRNLDAGGAAEAIRQSFKQWVTSELPRIQLPVRDELGDETILGGADRYQEVSDPPTAGAESTVVLKANASLSRAAKATVFVQSIGTTSFGGVQSISESNSGEVFLPQASDLRVIRAALIEYNPDLLDGIGSLPEQIAEVARTCWAAVFLRTEAVSSIGSFALNGLTGETEKLSTVYTIMARSPKSFVSTPHDAYYWEVLRNRPAGTVISADLEVLPRR